MRGPVLLSILHPDGPPEENLDLPAYFAPEITGEYHHDLIVLVSHDAVNKALLTYLAPELAETITACWNRLIRTNTHWRVDAYDRLAVSPTGRAGSRRRDS